MNVRDQTSQTRDTLLNISDPLKPTLGLDLDGCVDEAPKFFRTLSHFWPGEVIVVTYRSDRAKAIADLERHGIKFTDVVLVSSFDVKAEVIKERKINVYIDDQPEMLKNIPADVSVMLFRNEGNFDFDDRKWMFSEQTGKMV